MKISPLNSVQTAMRGISHCQQSTSKHIKENAGDSFKLSHATLDARNSLPFANIKDETLAALFPQSLLTKYGNATFLEKAMEANPQIGKIMDEVGIPHKIYPENISTGLNSHFIPTQKTALGIMKHCGDNFSKADYNTMTEATILHDIGKALIPKEILNKPGKLDPWERKVIDTHADLGYEILKTGGAKPRILNLVKNHHTFVAGHPSHADYPLEQIIQVADVWSALKEKRSYKEVFSDEVALDILYERAKKGDFEARFVDALKKFIKSSV